ncbi:MAG: LexA family transcriptional regulator [Muribaculaceae bacterium]|nr:LexA family transcriptional regulator [Muribaculaceae bacterium]
MTDKVLPKARPAETPVERLRYLLRQRRMSQAEMARTLGIDSARLSKIFSGRLPMTEGFINKVAVDMGVSKPWLSSGIGVPYEKPLHASTITSPVTPVATKGIAVYDVDVTAGTAELSHLLTDDHIIGYVDMPLISSDCVIVRVAGDSMTPVAPDGSYVAIRPVSSTGIIFWGQIYVVITDSYRMVKFIRRNPDPGYVTLHSDNPAYDDIDMPRSEIKKLFLVETVIKYDKRC